MNWIFDLFSNKPEKEASQDEIKVDREAVNTDLAKEIMDIDETALVKEDEKAFAAEQEVYAADEPIDEVGMIISYEQGDLSDADTLKLFSSLIKSGRAWTLQGHYGRTAKALIEAGWLDEKGNILKEIPASSGTICEYCGQEIFDKREESGSPKVDWATDDGDFGCTDSPETTEEGVGSHKPVDREACMASLKVALKKTAAYEKGDTREDTISKDYELKVKGLSNCNLAEMLSEYVTLENNTATLNFNEEKEKQIKAVENGREASEKKLLKYLGNHTLIDWKKSFKKMEDSEIKHPEEKDLYSEWKEAKMAWEGKKPDFESPSDKEKLEQMDGVGKEETKGQVGKEASLKTEAATPAEIVEKKVEKLIKEKIDEAFAEVPAVPAVEAPVVTDVPEIPVVKEDSPEDKILDKLIDNKPTQEKREEEKEVESSLKSADYNGWSNYETWLVGLWIDNEPFFYEEAQRVSGKDIYTVANHLKEMIEENQPEILQAAGVYTDLMTHSLSQVNWEELAEHYRTEGEPEEPEEVKPIPEPGKPVPEPVELEQEIPTQASKADVIKKVGEIDSPWIVEKQADGSEIIVRRDVRNKKKTNDENKKQSQNIK